MMPYPTLDCDEEALRNSPLKGWINQYSLFVNRLDIPVTIYRLDAEEQRTSRFTAGPKETVTHRRGRSTQSYELVIPDDECLGRYHIIKNGFLFIE